MKKHPKTWIAITVGILSTSAFSQQVSIDAGDGVVIRANGDNTAVVRTNGTLINAASGEGSVAETNIAGTRRVVRGSPGTSSVHVETFEDGNTSITNINSGPSRGMMTGRISESDLTNTDLSGRNFAGASFAGRTFTNVNLSDANLSGADLRDARFVNVNLSNTNLSGANLTGATFVNSEVGAAIVDGAIW